MAAVSKNYYDVLQWVYKVIYSCETMTQAIKCINLINSFKDKYPSKKFGDAIHVDHEILRNICYDRISSLGNESK